MKTIGTFCFNLKAFNPFLLFSWQFNYFSPLKKSK